MWIKATYEFRLMYYLTAWYIWGVKNLVVLMFLNLKCTNYQGGHIRTYFAVLLIFGKSFIVETKIFFEINPHYLSQHEH